MKQRKYDNLSSCKNQGIFSLHVFLSFAEANKLKSQKVEFAFTQYWNVQTCFDEVKVHL
jgi:hypothetical protein